MKRTPWLLVGLLVVAGAGVAAWALKPKGDEGSSSYHVNRLPSLPPGVTEQDVLPLNETLLAAFPAAARDAFVQAAREGDASFHMSWEERDRMYALIEDARRQSGRGAAGYYGLEGHVLTMGARPGH